MTDRPSRLPELVVLATVIGAAANAAVKTPTLTLGSTALILVTAFVGLAVLAAAPHLDEMR